MFRTLASLPWQIIKIIIVIVFVVGLVYFGACVYQNFFANRPILAPDLDDAIYQVTIEGTGRVLYSDDVDRDGCTYLLHGYWELKDKTFVWHNQDLKLDETLFGKVNIRVRE